MRSFRFVLSIPHRRTWITLMSTVFLITACGDPASGEGMEKPLPEESMPEIVSATEAVESPDIPTIDPSTMDESEIEKVIPTGPRCSFAYTAASPPIFAASVGSNATAQGVIKLHGRLVELTAQGIKDLDALATGAVFTAGPVQFDVKPEMEKGNTQDGKQRWPAEAHFKLRNELKVGYGGWYTCDDGKIAGK